MFKTLLSDKLKLATECWLDTITSVEHGTQKPQMSDGL